MFADPSALSLFVQSIGQTKKMKCFYLFLEAYVYNMHHAHIFVKTLIQYILIVHYQGNVDFNTVNIHCTPF